MLTAHQTVKHAWSKFKEYSRYKQLFLYNILAMLPVLLVEHYIGDDASLRILIYLASIPSMVFYFLTYMAITHYACTGWVFNSFREFLNPPSSIWRLFWKSTAVFILLAVPVIVGVLAIGGLGIIMSNQFILLIIIGAVATILFLVYLFKYMIKIIVVYPYFTMNDDASLLSSLNFSNGHWSYLSSILGWSILYGFLIIMLSSIAMAILGALSLYISPVVSLIITSLFMLLTEIFITIMGAFINSEAYKQIAEK